MKVLKLIFKNALRHKLRTLLTIFGISIAVIAFGLLRTVVTIWDSSVDATMANRLITRQAVSFIFPLPYSYKEKIEKVPGVNKVTFATWFQGVYKDKNNFFARMAVDPETMFDVYPEYIISPEELAAFKKERNACVIGADIAQQHKLKLGDQMVLEGDIYPGRWEFIVRGIYKGKNKNTDKTQMLFHWDYVNERMKVETPVRANDVGWYVVQIADPNKSALISNQIDALFKNSTAETKTETEKAFAQGFVAASGAIITAMNVMSFVIIGIIMLVLANTMIMAARERTREYAVFKTLGFSAKHLVGLILGESMVISFLGGGIGLFLTFPIVAGFEQAMPKGFFPFFYIEPITVVLASVATVLVGLISAIFPIHKALNTKIVDGFRFVG
ncbi:MAG: ABC transporter ATP-binding protein [Stygiobacter sp. RIFOXYC12_FULL_38_8]|nr:MAG: ABC transporter ATP-binding protein [Stygiobacter sp. RIFOXYA12_FULL_38_9]OGV06769.1 MAG: ABC transporter ATP-binding protein [Stygiobacter sp. RIFOXYB2_FULL_37_11]OGV13401.1 MAG: ABC transporter ATP-binding protein [Stygiobacter sp. RIFOXYC2_FULL_38_25]OGV22818.1 MAG: ABC transporter ATP-binding protein [Stygiobacter sp. RIFOXYC12_FULL_38_8]OGV81753.1 MAG: ABC transporter ATP-binding protein [Stygiobacter sp. GWF2_38_21]RJQ59862.1 MAG: ABC transporter permease [Stygiobacter sp.]